MNPRSRALISYFVGVSAGLLVGALTGLRSLSHFALVGAVAGVAAASVFLILARFTGAGEAVAPPPRS